MITRRAGITPDRVWIGYRKVTRRRRSQALKSVLLAVVLACLCFPVTGQTAIRAAFYYPWFPETWTVNGAHVFYKPTLGYYSSADQHLVDAHIKSLDWGRINAGISSWWGAGSKEDSRLSLLLNRTQSLASPLKWTIYYEREGYANPSVGELDSELSYLSAHYASHPSYLQVAGRPVLFVYNANDTTCEVVDRWKSANNFRFHLVLKVFSGFASCTNQPDGWHQYGPSKATQVHLPYSYAISPGFWRADEPTPRLARDIDRWGQNIRDQVASGATWQLITTFNEWGEGTSVEAAESWSNWPDCQHLDSGCKGSYLNYLRRDGAPPRSTFFVPATVKNDCSADATQPILDWIATVPDNSTLSFGSGACYRIDGTLALTNRNGLTLEGNNSTFRANGTGAPDRAHWRLVDGTRMTLRNMTIQGAHSNPGTRVDELQWQHGIDLRGVTGVDVDRVSILNSYGDCIYVGKALSTSTWTSDVHVRDSSCVGPGRQGIAVVAGRDVLAERVTLRLLALNAFDIEPNGTGDGAENVTLRDSSVTAPMGDNFFVVIGNGPVNGVTVSNNTLSGKGMHMVFVAPAGQRRSNVTVTGNSSNTGYNALGGAALDLVRIDGGTVTGNTIPLSGVNMALAALRESCNVNVSDNSYPGGVTAVRAIFPCPVIR